MNSTRLINRIGLSLFLALFAAVALSQQVSIPPFGAGQIPGTVTNDSAAAGNVGELLTQSRLSGSATSVTSGSQLNITASALALTPGSWEVSGVIYYVPAGTTVVSWLQCGISATTAVVDTTPGSWSINAWTATGQNLQQTTSIPCGPVRVAVSANTNYFLVGNSSFATSTMTAYGFIKGVRVR